MLSSVTAIAGASLSLYQLVFPRFTPTLLPLLQLSPAQVSVCLSSILLRLSASSLRVLGDSAHFIFALDEASSIRSIALSGRNLSGRYLTDIDTAAFTAPSVMVTPWKSS